MLGKIGLALETFAGFIVFKVHCLVEFLLDAPAGHILLPLGYVLPCGGEVEVGLAEAGDFPIILAAPIGNAVVALLH